MTLTHTTRNIPIRKALLLASFLVPALTVGQATRAEAVACSTAICASTGANSCTIGNVTLDSGCPCSLDFGSSMDVLVSGTLNANGCGLKMTANSFDVTGTLRDGTGSYIDLETSGTGQFFKTRGSGSVDVKHGGSFSAIVPGGDCNVGGGTIDASGVSPDCSGGSVDLACDTLTITKAIHTDGACSGDDSGDAGDITLSATDSASLSGAGTITANAAGSETWGGTISVSAGTTLSQGKTIQTRGGNNGTGGDIELGAGGALTVTGQLNTSTSGADGDGGDIYVDGGATVSCSAEWNTNGGWYNAGDVTVSGTGDVSIACPINALGSSGGNGGTIEISSDEDLVVDGAITATGAGALAYGGDVALTAGSNHTVEVKKAITATAGNSGSGDGNVDIIACNIAITNDITTRNAALGIRGRNVLDYAGTLTLTAGDSLLADGNTATSCDLGVQTTGNVINCRCPDADNDGSCDSQTCVSAPTLSGTVTPTALVCPTAMPACS